MSDKYNVPEDFKALAESFFGSTAGNIHSPIWFCGLEWGGGYDPEVPILWDLIQPYDFEELHTWSTQSFMDSFWASRSQFCQNVIKILVGLQQGYFNSGDNRKGFECRRDEEWFADLGRRRIVGPNGLALILNMLPISVPNRSVCNGSWQKYKIRKNDGSVEEFPKWTGLKDFYEYESEVIRLRSNLYTRTRARCKPKLIICFGKGSEDKFKLLWGVDTALTNVGVTLEDGKTITYQYTWLDEETTLFVVAPFPANSGGINSDDKVNKISSSIVALCKEKLGENWLGDYALQDPNQAPLEPDSQLVEQHANLYKLKNEIIQYKEGVNKVCTQLESIGETLKSLPRSTDSSLGDWSRFNERIDEMRADVLSQLNKLDDMKDTVENQIKEVDKELWSNWKK